jgi:hypothetical protein
MKTAKLATVYRVAPLFIFLFVSCSNRTPKDQLSTAQTGLYNLGNAFTRQYKEAGNTIARDEVVNRFDTLLDEFVKHNEGYYLDSMQVALKSLEIDTSGRIRAVFTDSVCKYWYVGRFDNGEQMKKDTSYLILKRLTDQSINTVSFFAGFARKANPISDTAKPFEIEVTPIKEY